MTRLTTVGVRAILVALVGVGLALVAVAQQPNQAPKPKPKRSPQYKRVHQQAFRKVLNDNAAGAIEQLQKQPEDGETHYMLAVAHAAQKQTDKAIAHVKKAIELGLPPERFVAGTLTGLDGLQNEPLLRSLRTRLSGTVLHGPMLGSVGGDSVRVWVRVLGEQTVHVEASPDRGLAAPVRSQPVRADRDSDYTATILLDRLKPNTRYYYRVLVGGQPSAVHSFRTLARPHQPIRFRLAFGGGAGYVPPHERMWNTIGKERPDVLMLLGDNVYIDDPTSPPMQHYCYYRRQSRPEFRALVAKTPVFSIWDDHDFGTNDCQGGPAIDAPPWKRPVYRVFRNNWANPAYGGGEKHPGIYYDFHLGDIHFVMLDGRYYRNLKPKDGSRPSMLGPTQKAWLLDTIGKSRGKLLVLCSPVPWVFRAKGTSKDTWNGFKDERNEIFTFLSRNKVEGVVLMSADRHRSDLWKIDRADGYPLFELNSSRLTNQHVHPTMKQAVFSYNAKQSFGTVDFDTTVDDPTVTYRILSIDGEQIHKHTIRRSLLR